jgi:hypothetical protein
MTSIAITISILKFILEIVKAVVVSVALTLGTLIGFALVGLSMSKVESWKKARKS